VYGVPVVGGEGGGEGVATLTRTANIYTAQPPTRTTPGELLGLRDGDALGGSQGAAYGVALGACEVNALGACDGIKLGA
jgi:hypothetical protein